MIVSVAIPVRDAGPLLGEVLDAVLAQQMPAGCELELVICDSGSRDGSASLARQRGAKVLEIASREFSHGGTRNLLMEQTHGEKVAFLTQDAVPATGQWLARLLEGFAVAPEVGLAFGPYLPRPGASATVRRELASWFGSLSPDGEPRVDRLAADERGLPPLELMGPRGFFTDANGCISREAWRRVPFRRVAYAEDHLLAHDMLRAGFTKVYVPHAAVVHSHDYENWEWLRRSFDEARAVREIYRFEDLGDPRRLALWLRGSVGGDWRWSRGEADGAREVLRHSPALLARSTLHHGARAAGTLLGARAERLPRWLVRRLSLERRG